MIHWLVVFYVRRAGQRCNIQDTLSHLFPHWYSVSTVDCQSIVPQCSHKPYSTPSSLSSSSSSAALTVHNKWRDDGCQNDNVRRLLDRFTVFHCRGRHPSRRYKWGQLQFHHHSVLRPNLFEHHTTFQSPSLLFDCRINDWCHNMFGFSLYSWQLIVALLSLSLSLSIYIYIYIYSARFVIAPSGETPFGNCRMHLFNIICCPVCNSIGIWRTASKQRSL